MNEPTYEQLKTWLEYWTRAKKSAYADLTASYTDEQRAIIRRMNHAERQANLCRQRMICRYGYSGKRKVAWPQEPPTEAAEND